MGRFTGAITLAGTVSSQTAGLCHELPVNRKMDGAHRLMAAFETWPRSPPVAAKLRGGPGPETRMLGDRRDGPRLPTCSDHSRVRPGLARDNRARVRPLRQVTSDCHVTRRVSKRPDGTGGTGAGTRGGWPPSWTRSRCAGCRPRVWVFAPTSCTRATGRTSKIEREASLLASL